MEVIIAVVFVVIVALIGYAVGRIVSMFDCEDILLEGNEAVEKKLAEDEN